MKIYLVRHGDALSVDQDAQRPLSEKGIAEVKKTADFLQKNNIQVERIYHSGKLRAVQTAEIIAKTLDQNLLVEFLNGMDPDDPVHEVAIYCNHWEKDVMLVGHLPFLPKLVTELVLTHDYQQFVEFATGGILCLERKGHFNWFLNWLIDPSLL